LGSNEEQILIDGNREAEGDEYYHLGGWAVSPRQDLLAFTEDTRGRRQHTLRFREIVTGRDLPERIAGLQARIVWAGDNRTVYYVENDPVTLLSTRVRKHVLGTDPKSDPIVYEEKDKSFYLGVGKTGDQRFILIRLGSTMASEVRFLAADGPSGTLRVLAPRETGVLYKADHIGGRWVIKTNWKAPNFRMMTVADGGVGKGSKAKWRELVPHDPKIFIQDFVAFADHLALSERSDGLLRLRYAPWAAPGRWTYVRSDDPASTQTFDVNVEQGTPLLRYAYSSLATPDSIYELDMRTGERKLLKRQPVPGYDPAGYTTERIWATARGCRCRSSTARVLRGTARPRCTRRLTALTAAPMIPSSTARSPRSSTAASCTRSRTSAAGRSWAALGTRTAGCSGRRTPSPTSSTSPTSWCGRSTPRRTRFSRSEAAPVAC
jgi:oligopeptidase B